MAQWVRDLALSLLWLRFDPWPRNFHMLQARTKGEKKISTVEDRSLTQSDEGKAVPCL